MGVLINERSELFLKSNGTLTHLVCERNTVSILKRNLFSEGENLQRIFHSLKFNNGGPNKL